jgi:hypothetical protein
MFILSSKLETSLLTRLVAPLVAGLLVTAAYHSGAQAASTRTYVISDEDGYGVIECLVQKSDCGKVVADSWCESHGHGPATAFGRADDVTASIATDAPRPAIKPDAAMVACSE